MDERYFPDEALEVRPIIEREAGRWVLWLEILMIPDRDNHVVKHRVADYATEDEARVAARWMVGAANRNLPRPPLGY